MDYFRELIIIRLTLNPRGRCAQGGITAWPERGEVGAESPALRENKINRAIPYVPDHQRCVSLTRRHGRRHGKPIVLVKTDTMWEVDPETRSKVSHETLPFEGSLDCSLSDLLMVGQDGNLNRCMLTHYLLRQLQEIQKRAGSGNEKCCDCGAPSPQWVCVLA